LGEVEALHGLADVVADDAPQALVGDADEAGGGQHRHLTHSIIATCSNSSVKRLPSRAHGTVIRRTPCSGQSVRGTLAVMEQ
jgi:hypothetical protein